MGQITSLFVRKVLGAMGTEIDQPALLQSLGMDPDSATDPALMISDAQYYAFLEQLASLVPEAISIPLRAGAAMRCDDYGAFGLAWKSAPDLQGSYSRAARYARVLTSVSAHELEFVEGGAFMHLHREGERRLGLRLSNEATIASIVSISRQASTQPFNPVEVHFKHPAPASLDAHEAYFGCPLRFDSDRDALLVSTQSLQAPNHLGDESIARFFDVHLEAEVSKLEREAQLDQQVRQHISRALSDGVPTISAVARQMDLSARTLQRRLADKGYSFQTLIDESRRQLARRLLRQTDYSLAEVAFMTGFSEQSAFTRAFRRWEGQTPRSYRLHAQG